MSTEPRRAAIYLRISQDRENTRLGVDRHREDAEALIKARGWAPAGVYEDNDISGVGKQKRPAFERLLTDIERGLIDVVVAQEWPRLERNRSDGVRVIEAAQRHEILLTFAKGSDIDCTTAAGRISSRRSRATRSRSRPNVRVAPNGSVQSKDAPRRECALLATPSKESPLPTRHGQWKRSTKRSLLAHPCEPSQPHYPERAAQASPKCRHSHDTHGPSRWSATRRGMLTGSHHDLYRTMAHGLRQPSSAFSGIRGTQATRRTLHPPCSQMVGSDARGAQRSCAPTPANRSPASGTLSSQRPPGGQFKTVSTTQTA